MKKINIVLMSILTIILSSVLAACTFKSPEVFFKTKEIVISVEDSINLDEYLDVKGIEKRDVEYRFSNSSIFSYDNRIVTAVESGKTFVYATYQNNNLDSMQLIVRKTFEAPYEFSLSKDGQLSWNAVSAFYENETTPTFASSYFVQGFYVDPVDEELPPVAFNEQVSTNSYTFQNSGIYILTVKAKGAGYFDDSTNSEEQTFYFGYMDRLTQDDLTWTTSNGLLSWTSISGAKYKVKMDGVLLGDFQTTNTKDMSSYFDNATAGTHSLSVVVYDETGSKIAQESEQIEITKLEKPQVDYNFSSLNGGMIEIVTNNNVQKYQLTATKIGTETSTKLFLDNASDKVSTTLNGFEEGIYQIDIVAVNDGENFYQSNKLSFGKVYKMGEVAFEGTGSNLENGNEFNARVSSSTGLVESKLNVLGLSGNTQTTGISIGNTEKNIVLNITSKGIYNVSVVQIPNAEFNTINGQSVYVINSDISSQIVVNKLESFSVVSEETILHEYVDNHSVLNFNKVALATSYDLMYFDGTSFIEVAKNLYTLENVSETENSFVFLDKVENLFVAQNNDNIKTLKFKIVAQTNDEKLTINSSTEKTLTFLNAPVSASSGNSTDKVYKWNASNDANSYRVEIYDLNKDLYIANKDNINIDISSLTSTIVEETSAQHTFENVGYYYVRIYALSNQEDKFISSDEYLEEVFFISEKLETGVVKFGFDENYKNHSGFTQSSGYYVKITNAPNVDNYQLIVNSVNNGMFQVSSGDESIYLLAEDFSNPSTEIVVSVVAHANDETLYVASDEEDIVVERLAAVDYSDLQIDDLTANIVVAAKSGVKKIKIWKDDSNYVLTDNGQDAVFAISRLSNFALTFNLFGSSLQNTIFADTNGKIYLDSDTSTMTFSRLQAPTSFKYYNGDLTFEHLAVSGTKYYVLDLLCTIPDGEKIKLSLKFDTILTAVYEGLNIGLSVPSANFITFSGNNVSIKLGEVLDLVKLNPTIAGIYNQATDIEFSVYGYQNRNSSGSVTLSSPYASIYGDATKTTLKVEKMNSTNMTFANTTTDYTLSWEPVNASASVAAETSYQVFMNNSAYGDKINAGLSYTFSNTPFATSTYYEFYVKASNPYYLESNNSNLVKIYRLRNLQKITLGTDKTFGYEILTSEKDFCDHVDVTIGGTTSPNTSGKVGITAAGDYTLQIIGKKIENADSKIYYIDSQPATWTLTEMDALKPTDETIDFTNNLLSWNAYGTGKTFASLCYVIVFKDSKGGTVKYITKETSVNLATNLELFNSISSLQTGNINIGVSAYLEPYSVLSGGSIYYSLDKTLLDGNVENNHWLYQSDKVIKKLTTPEVENVEFVHTDLTDAQFPDIKITFVGNYGDSGKFNIYLNDTLLKTYTINAVDEKYVFVLTKDDYNGVIQVGASMTIRISALSDNDIPSSAGSVEVTRAVDLQEIGLEPKEEKFSQSVLIKFDAENLQLTAGGIVLKVDYQQNGDEMKTEYLLVSVDSLSETLLYDLTDFIKTNLSLGGTIKLSAYINNYSKDSVYYLAGPNTIVSSTFNVLNSVPDVTKKAGGFTIDSTLNNETTKYIVSYGGSMFEVSKNGDFYFEFPNSWVNGTYELKFHAEENGYVNSVETKISFVLNRLGKITSVTMTRDAVDLSAVNLSWNAVSGASKYIVRLYSKDDVEKQNLLYSFEGTKTSYSVIEMFGENYQLVYDFGVLSPIDFLQDIEVVFEIIAVGDNTSNNSQSYEFFATIKGNNLLPENIMVDQYGIITFASISGVDYLYRLNGSDGSVYQDWKKIKATSSSTKLQWKGIDADKLFNVDIIAMGSAVNEPASSNDYIFEIDSVSITTKDSGITFKITTEITRITYDPSLPSDLAITLNPTSFTKLYAGLSSDALYKEAVVAFAPEMAIPGEGDENYIYSYNLIDLISLLRENGLDVDTSTNDTKIYLWTYKDTSDVSSSYVSSKVYEFAFKFVVEDQFKEIKKLGAVTGNVNYTEDYVNTYALFFNNDVPNALQTLGIFVRVTQIESEQSSENMYSTTKFIAKDKLIAIDYFFDEGLFALNLTEIFERSDLLTLSGKFKVEFARLQVELTSNADGEKTYKYIVTDWFAEDSGKTFEFTRLPAVKSLRLSSGNLYWESVSEKASKYYVYFIEDLDGENLGEKYSYFSTTNTYYYASDFVSPLNKYYLAVQGINEDPYILSSKRVFITEVSGGVDTPAVVYKNQINSKLALKDGKMIIDWDTNGDFYKTLTSGESYSKIAEALGNTVFTSPFSFTLKQLVENNISLRVRFTSLKSGSEGIRKSFDVNAKFLLTDLYNFGDENGFDIKTRLGEVYANAGSSSSTKDSIFKFIEAIENGSHGVANYRTLFDDCFEAIQTGSYKIDYCLVGNNKTLNSAWYNFENVNGENTLYINEEPSVKAIKTKSETDKSINSYKVLIKKSKIYNYVGGTYTLETAENYIMKISTSVGYKAFSITKGINKYSLSMLETDISKTVSVYETDSAGELTSGGNYLMFYINYNDGDSILGTYGSEIEKVSYQMQIFAVGNNYSASSKSEYFSLVLLGFGQSFAINNGVFSWTPQTNRNTTVIYKKNTSASESEVEVDGSMAYARFSLDGLGYGLYDYIKFVNIGEIKNKSIFVDSEIYEIDNLYKLNSPSLTNDFGNIAINDTANKVMLENCYSDVNLYNYMLYNNKSTAESYIAFSDDNKASSVLLYEVGTTGINNTNPDYIYKNTEKDASTFSVASIGTTSAVNIEQDATKYYLRRMYCKDVSTGESTAKSIAVRSQFASLNAQMLDEVTNVRINDGILNWDSVNGRNGETTLTLPTTGGAKVVYKITIAKYKISNTVDGETEANIGEEKIRYTTKTSFDFATLTQEIGETNEDSVYLKVYVQALAMNVTDRVPAGKSVQLVEGGYAYGNLQYVETPSYVLMGEGVELARISRLDPIVEGSLRVDQGNLYWNYKSKTSLTEDNFFDTYSFVVVDENGKIINGILTATANTQTDFTIKFVENGGAMNAGNKKLKVYASQGSLNTDLIIKSFPTEIEITKLDTIKQSDFVIDSDSTTETLDLSSYFANANVNAINAHFTIIKEGGLEEEVSVDFDKTSFKMFILREESDSDNLPIPYPIGYVNKYIVVSTDQIVKMTFKVSNRIENTLFSDLSEEFLLQRSSWGENGQITWDEENQEFNWVYDGYYSLKNSLTADKVQYRNILTKETILYEDLELSKPTAITLQVGAEIVVDEILSGCAKINYNENYYYIDKTNYENKVVVIGSDNLNTSDLFKILETNLDTTLIVYDNGNVYSVASSEIVKPVYIVEATYGTSPEVVRIYQTTETTFIPTIVGRVSVKIRIKLGSTNIQSKDLEYVRDDGSGNTVKHVDFNLFASGAGTSSSPYLITTNQQFKNISLRMTKAKSLLQFVENNRQVNESEQFYFSIQNSLILSEKNAAESYLSGVLFRGDFEGIIEGNEKTISYISGGVSNLSNGITVAVGNVLGPGNESYTTFNYGTSLFEKLAANSSISNLNLNVEYASATISNHSLMAGLTLSNSGKIENVNLVGFKNGFIGYKAPNERTMMIYSGIASINIGGFASIKDCKAQSSMEINDSNFSQLIFVSGIVYTNYATIENCIAGKLDDTTFSINIVCNKTTDTVQVAGIAITNNSSASIKNCQNFYDITVEGTNAQNQIVVYIAGIVDLGMGTMTNNSNSGTLNTINIGNGYLYKGDIVAVMK